MAQNKMQVYEAYTNSDLIEGRGVNVHIGYFKKEHDALQAAKGQGVMGTDAHVKSIEIIVYDSYEDFVKQRDTRLLKSIKQKLSADELRVLGLSKY